MNTLKRLLILIVFLAIFVTLIISLSFYAGQMPNSVDIIPKSYQSKIQLTFQAGYDQLLKRVAGLLGAASEATSQEDTLTGSTPVPTSHLPATPTTDTARPESNTEIFTGSDFGLSSTIAGPRFPLLFNHPERDYTGPCNRFINRKE